MAGERRPGLILQHGVDAPPALLTEWARARGIEHEVHPTWQEPLPADPAAYGWIATLGSEHTPGADGAPDWVDAVIGFLRRALELDVPVLGLCFGGQALAVAAGGSVGPSDPPEIGWYEVATSDPALVPPGPWLHYHYDQLTPPPNADVIARAGSGPAAFVLGRSLGLQFHPESTAEIGAAWARMDAAQRTGRGFGGDGLFDDPPETARTDAMRLFDAWWELAGDPRATGMGTLSKIGGAADDGAPSETRRST